MKEKREHSPNEHLGLQIRQLKADIETVATAEKRIRDDFAGLACAQKWSDRVRHTRRDDSDSEWTRAADIC